MNRRRFMKRRNCITFCLFILVTFIDLASCMALSNDGLWGLRVASGALTYVGLVAYTDSPKGEITVDPSAVRVGPSQVEGAGLGLYCAQSLSQGTVLGTYPGVVLPIQQGMKKLRMHPQCESYIWRFSDNTAIIDPTDSSGDIQSICKGGNPASFLSRQILKLLPLGVPTTLCRINEPPIGASVNVAIDEDLQSKRVSLSLSRDVYEGEELFMDYGISYDRSSYGGDKSG